MIKADCSAEAKASLAISTRPDSRMANINLSRSGLPRWSGSLCRTSRGHQSGFRQSPPLYGNLGEREREREVEVNQILDQYLIDIGNALIDISENRLHPILMTDLVCFLGSITLIQALHTILHTFCCNWPNLFSRNWRTHCGLVKETSIDLPDLDVQRVGNCL